MILKEKERIVAREDLEEDREIIKKFMEKYGEEWKKLGEDWWEHFKC